MNCRHCGVPLQHQFLDLGFAPPSNAYLQAEDLRRPERTYPLKLFVCAQCWLVQTEDHAGAGELFGEHYAYFSSVSSGWLDHARRYAEAMIREARARRRQPGRRGGLERRLSAQELRVGGDSLPGIEPTANTAAAAEAMACRRCGEFFGTALAERLARGGPPRI